MTEDLVLYTLTNEGSFLVRDIAKFMKANSGLETLSIIAASSEDDHWNAAEQRRENPSFQDSTRELAAGFFENTEIICEQGVDTMKIPKGKPVFIVNPVYFHGEEKISVGTALDFLTPAIEKIIFQSPESDIFVVFPDVPYALSHNQDKYLARGHHQAEMLKSRVLYPLRVAGVKGMISYYAHCPDQIMEGCKGTVKIGKNTFPDLEEMVWVDWDPYGGYSLDGKFFKENKIITPEMRPDLFPYETVLEGLRRKNVLVLLPDSGSKQKIQNPLGDSFEVVTLDKIRYHEGKIQITLSKDEFNFIDYVRSMGFKDGDTLIIALTDDFLNKGGTANKSVGMVKKELWKAMQEVYDSVPNVFFESYLMVAHAKTIGSVRLYNLGHVYYTDTHRRAELHSPRDDVFGEYIREQEKDGLPENWQPKKTYEKQFSCAGGLATAINILYNERYR